MGRKPLAAAALLAALALAGCSGGGDDDPSASTSGSLSSSGTGLPNRAPTAQLNASVANGTSPLNVTFTIDGADADNDTLDWTLAFGDGNETNGTRLPANVTHAYATEANLTVLAVLTVSDGVRNATANVTLTVTPADASSAALTILEGEVATNCATQEGCYTVGSEGCAGWLLHEQGLDCVWFELAPELVGLPFVTESSGDVDVDFRTDCELTGSSVVIFGAGGQEEGEIPDAGCAVLFDYDAGGLLRLIIG